MSFDDKKEYSRVLLACATQRHLVMACPLAFGEVGVKERVKTILNYKKPAFWITVAAIVVCIIIAVCFLTKPAKEYQIRITIPAGSTEAICYSDEEICPNGSTLTLENGDGLGDTEVVLLPVEYSEENTYEPTYMTSGMPVKIDVEKGAWFKIGVNMQNPTADDINVYVSAKDVEVRIADSDSIAEMGEDYPVEKPTLQQVMERIVNAIPLEEAVPLTTTADLPMGDQLYCLDSTANESYTLYGFHSDEYGYAGLLIDYKIGGKSNLTYMESATNWIGYEFPTIEETLDGGLFLTYCWQGGSGVHIDKFFYFEPYSTGHLECYELKTDNLLEQVNALVEFKLDEEQEVVNVFKKENGKSEHFAQISYADDKNGQELKIKGINVGAEQIRFRTDPTLIMVGIGLELEDSLMPLVIGDLAVEIDVEKIDGKLEFVIHDVSTYATEGILELEAKQGAVSEEEAVEIVRMQLIQAYENRYGTFEASDIQPTIYSSDEERLSYIIPRLAVSEITEDFYVIPVIWDFRVYKDTGKVTVYYNGIDPFEYEFDPNNPQHLTFAG